MLGSRTGQTGYSWDGVNRLTGFSTTTTSNMAYKYRADGMRVSKLKVTGNVSTQTQATFYDGQMPVETVDFGTTIAVSRNFVGARGIEAIFTTTPTSDTTSYPLYDAHGNMISTLSKAGNSYVNSNVRTYDVWGGVRTGAQTAGPNNRYCASLGHVQDDESGLIYMRARYYVPRSGRFISEDPECSDPNWFAFCNNDPINYVDGSGEVRESRIIDGLRFELDKGLHGWDLHVFEGGSEIWSRYADGSIKHGVVDCAERIYKAIGAAFKSGGKSDLAFLNKLFKAGGFGFMEEMVDMAASSAKPGMAVSSLDAYMQQNPVDFFDTLKIIFSGGSS